MKSILFALLGIGLCLRAEEVKTVHFQSDDGKTELVAYLFEPATGGVHPAVVLLHGRSGPYSSLAHGRYSAQTLSKRHKFWAAYWTERGYVALLVDSYSPRGYGAGFPKHSHAERPPEVSEETVRPLDAYAGLRFLREQRNVKHEHVFLQGWSNGAMTALVTMSAAKLPGDMKHGFRAAIAEYPGCHMASVQGDYHAYAPILLVLGTDDDEVGYKGCEEWSKQARSQGNEIERVVEEGAMHDFDDPSESKQEIPANHAATEDMVRRAEPFFAKFY